MKDIQPAEMEYLLQYIYLGEVEIPSQEVEGLIKISKDLGIVGLNEVKSRDGEVPQMTTSPQSTSPRIWEDLAPGTGPQYRSLLCKEQETDERKIPKVAKRKYEPPQKAIIPKMAKVERDTEAYEDEDFFDEYDGAENDEGEEDDQDQDHEDEEDQDHEEHEDDPDDQEDQEDNEVPEVTESENMESCQEKNLLRQSLPQQRIDRKREEEKQNSSLIGSVAKTMEGRRRHHTFYIIGDYIYVKERLFSRNDGSKKLTLSCSSSFKQCRGSVHIDPGTSEWMSQRITTRVTS